MGRYSLAVSQGKPLLPPHLEPAREFYDALAEMIAAEVLRRLKAHGQQAELLPLPEQKTVE